MATYREHDVQGDQGEAAFRAGQSGPLVVLDHVDLVGLHLAICLLEAGYRVAGVNVADRCRPALEQCGAMVLDSRSPDSAAWLLECHEQENPHPDVLARTFAGRAVARRPRLELTGDQRRSTPDSAMQPLASITLRPPGARETSLHVVLALTSRGPELTVRGERALFERALPLLTALADRVLYSPASDDFPA